MRSPSFAIVRRPAALGLTRAAILTATALLTAACGGRQPGSVPSPSGERDRAIHLLSRATYGVRPQDVEEVMRMGRRTWLDRQLRPSSIADNALEARLATIQQAAPTAGIVGVVRAVAVGAAPAGAPAVTARPGAQPTSTPSSAASVTSRPARDTSVNMESALRGMMSAQQALVAAQQKLLASQQALVAARQPAATNQPATTVQRQLAEAQQQLSAAQQDLVAAQRQLATSQSQLALAQRAQTVTARAQPVQAGTPLRAPPQAAQPVAVAVRAAVNPTASAVPVALPAGTIVTPVALHTTQTAAQVLNTMVASKLARAVYSERQLEAVMTDFWFNHFNVVYNKPAIHSVLRDYEENAIRRNVFGRFEDMLVAVAKHPAMMVYLDNYLSSSPVPGGPPTTARPAVRPGSRGLNENYARELLELHTLGVDGGYAQQDVIETARAFTGWGVVSRTAAGGVGAVVVSGGPTLGGFAFVLERHDDGEKTVLGRKFPAGGGMDDGVDILKMLARHPSTARHVATKLARHFVADDPPQRLIDELARVFRQTDGDLREVTRTLFSSDAFYDRAYHRAKVKRPFEFVASALRVAGAEVGTPAAGVVTQLRNFRHLPYGEAVPTGYPTTAEEWVSAGALLGRMNFAMDVMTGRVAGITLPPATAAPATDPAAIAEDVVQRTLFGVPSLGLQTVIAEDLTRQPPSSRTTPAARATALALGSPEFQRY